MPATEFSATQYHEAYPDGVERHFWHLARNRLIASTLRRLVPDAGRVLEIGCGPAIVLGYLRGKGVDCWGCELGDPPLPEAVDPFVFARQDCCDLDPAFRHGIDTLLLFDVLEHISDEIGFLRQMHGAFPNCRAIVVTVPARAELWSNYDDHYGHFRRYDRSGLRAALDKGGFAPTHDRYFFHELYLPVFLATKRAAQREIEIRAPEHPLVHRLLARTSGVCSSVLPSAIPGTSLIAVARRNPGYPEA